MKNLLLQLVSTLTFMLLLQGETIAQIQSTQAGGPWDSTWTWVQGVVPNAAHDVIINGPVYSSTNACNNLTISPGGSIQNNYYNYNLQVNGNMVNNGSVSNNSGYLILSVRGNITNNGNWTNRTVYIDGLSDQTVSCLNGNPFEGYEMINSKTGGNLHFDGNAFFHNCFVKMGGKVVYLNASSTLNLHDGYLYNCELQGNGNTSVIYGTGTFNVDAPYLQFVQMHNLALNGTINISTGCSANGSVLNIGSLQNDYYNYSFELYDEFINNGTIQNYSGLLTLKIYGNFTNNHVIDNYAMDYYGSGDQQISLAAGKNFSPVYLTSFKPSGMIKALTNLSFSDCQINMNNDTLLIPDNGSLNLSGGHLTNTHLLAEGAKSGFFTYHSENGAYTKNSTLLNATLTGTFECNNGIFLKGTTTNNGNFENDYYGYSPELHDLFINNGLILNNGNNLTLKIYGDFINNNTVDNYAMDFYGDTDQSITLKTGEVFSPSFWTSFKPAGKFTAQSDLVFNDTKVNFAFDTLMIPHNALVALDGGYLYRGIIFANNSKNGNIRMKMEGDAYLQDSELFNPEFLGKVRCKANTFHGEILVSDTLENDYFGYNQTIVGNVVNNGVIRDYVNYLVLYISGNITNNGVWSNRHTHLNGTTDQHVTCLNNQFFSGYQVNIDKSTGLTYFDDLVRFENVVVTFNGHQLELPANSTLYMHDGVLNSCVLHGNGPTSVFHGEGVFDVDAPESESSTFEDIRFTGEHLFESNCALYGATINDGSIQNNYYSYSTEVYGELINNGTLRNYVNHLTIKLYGDLVNNGIIDNHAIDLYGTGNQFITLQTGKQLSPTFVTSFKPAGKIISNSSLYFNDTKLNLSGDTLEMPAGSTLSILGQYLTNSAVFPAGISKNVSFALNMGNEAYLQGTNIHDAQLTGTIDINSNNTFHGTITNNGILRNDYYTYSLNIFGSMVNNDTIQNYVNYLYLYISGNVTNNGVWINNFTQLNGTSDQFVTIRNNHPIDGQTRYMSNTTGSPYQWYWNGSPMPASPDYSGQNNQEIVFNVPITGNMAGSAMYCAAGGGNSRSIIFGSEITNFQFDLKAFLQGPFNGSGMNTSLNTGGYLPLSQPYGTDPWNYFGSEAVASIPNGNVVDWILVELRDAPTASQATGQTIIARQAAFVLSDGSIAGTDGISIPGFNNLIIQHSLFAVLWHRNSIGVMSAYPLTLNGGVFTYDFTTAATQAYGSAHKQLAPGVWGMIGGDGNADGQINNSDKLDIWAVQAGSNGYLSGDFNMDSQVNNADKIDVWVPNSGLGGQVPN